ncbi:MAG: hypothetical protein GY845_27835 [Planctomycetes bacterium]|nr:hypothetical protein [Planctomycetota bacterium]
MNIFKTFIVFFIILMFSFPVVAHEHDHDDPHLHEADFGIELDDCNAIHVEPHLLGSELDALFFFWTDEPGFDSHAGTFPAGSSVGFNILDALKKWNGNGYDVLDPNTEETLTVSFLFGSTFATCETGAGFVEGFDVPVAADGSWHKHLGYTLNGTDNNDPNSGIYLLALEINNTSSEPNITSSNPFWIVFNLGMPEEDHHESIHWVEENLSHLPDLEQDSQIDLKDFAILASQWFNTDCDCWNNWCNGADITEDGIVDLPDLAKFASNWLNPMK